VIIPDVNIWIPALRADTPDHLLYRDWLTTALAAKEPVGLSELVWSGVVRIMTNPRVFRHPSSAASVIAALDEIRSAEGTQVVRPGGRHWSIFTELCASTAATGNLVADAYHAALAIENNATFVTADRDFATFPNLLVRDPFD